MGGNSQKRNMELFVTQQQPLGELGGKDKDHRGDNYFDDKDDDGEEDGDEIQEETKQEPRGEDGSDNLFGHSDETDKERKQREKKERKEARKDEKRKKKEEKRASRRGDDGMTSKKKKKDKKKKKSGAEGEEDDDEDEEPIDFAAWQFGVNGDGDGVADFDREVPSYAQLTGGSGLSKVKGLSPRRRPGGSRGNGNKKGRSPSPSPRWNPLGGQDSDEEEEEIVLSFGQTVRARVVLPEKPPNCE